MSTLEIRPITAAETRPLRSAVLRPHQRPDELVYPGDDAPDTRHFGAFAGEELTGIASIYREPPPGESDSAAWRLRGMAVLPPFQGLGVGRLLLEACLEYIRQQGGTVLWCNARTPAVGFYRTLGFQVRGEEFELPDIGPHFFMWRTV